MYSRASCVIEVELIIISPFVDVSLDVPDVLDISHLKGNGLQPGEEELPVADDSQSKQGFQIIILFCKANSLIITKYNDALNISLMFLLNYLLCIEAVHQIYCTIPRLLMM